MTRAAAWTQSASGRRGDRQTEAARRPRPRAGRDTDPATKRAREVRPVGKTRERRALFHGSTTLEVAARGLQAQEALVLVRRKPSGGAKAAGKMELRQPRFPRELVERDRLREGRAQV